MFTISQIHAAHDKVKSGADFPAYIREIKALGVNGFTTWVKDSHTEYFGANDYRTQSAAMYTNLPIAGNTDKPRFEERLKAHQNGATDYLTFCRDCAETGVEKWIVNLSNMTCIYYDKKGNEVLVETIPLVSDQHEI